VSEDWERRDRPLLDAIANVDGQKAIGTDRIATQLGLERRDVWTGLQALRDGRYIDWTQHTNPIGDAYTIILPRVLERGRRTIGSWPAEGVDALVQLLEARIAEAGDAETRGRLERLRDAVIGVGRDVATSVLTAWLKQQVGVGG
jgi:hypothetical protein